MNAGRPEPLSNRLRNPSGSLSRLLARARRLGELDRMLRNHLGPPCDAHARLANVDGNVAVIQADSPAWATRLRFRQGEILDYLRRLPAMDGLTQIRFIVDPPTRTDASGSRTARLSLASATFLHAVAQSTEHEPLRRALWRLAQSRRT